MTTYIIVTRNPSSKELLTILVNEKIAEFPTEDAAMEMAKTIGICRSWGAEILPVGGFDGVEP